MNSNSGYNYNCNCNCNDDLDTCRKEKNKKERRPCPTVIKCSSPGSVSIPALTTPGSTFTPTSLTLNTFGMCDPCTKLEFTSNITAPVGFIGTLSFQVFKQCRNQLTPVPVGPAFTFSRTVALVVGEANTFTFFICDCDSCNDDCCTYTVVITNQSAITLGATVNNATLGAITTCQVSSCNC